MRKYIYISIGGFLGAILRTMIREIRIEDYPMQFPVNTLAVNVTGCFLLAAFLTFAFETLTISADLRLGIATGFIGAFTTFSTMCKEISILLFQGFYITALSYAIISILLGLGLSYIGYKTAYSMIHHRKGK